MRRRFLPVWAGLVLLLCPAPASSGDFDDLRAVYEKGAAHLERGELDEAREYFMRAVELNSRFAPAYQGLGFAFYHLGYLDQAITNLERAVALGIDEPPIHYVLGVAYTRNRQMNDALEAYRRVIELNPSFSQAHHNLGLLYYQEKNWDGALASLEKALELEPDNRRVLFALGLVYIKRDDTAKAIDMITTLRRLRDETKAAKLENILRPPPEAPAYLVEPDPSLFEPVAPQPVRSRPAGGFTSSPGSISITGRVQVTMQGMPPEPEE